MISFDDFLAPSAFGDVVNERLRELSMVLTITKRNIDPSQVATQTLGYPTAADLLRIVLTLLEDAKNDIEQETGEDQFDLETAIGAIENVLDEVES